MHWKTNKFLSAIGDAVEYFFASDASAIIEHTNRVIFLEDDDVAAVCKGKQEDLYLSRYFLVTDLYIKALLKLLHVSYLDNQHFFLCIQGIVECVQLRLFSLFSYLRYFYENVQDSLTFSLNIILRQAVA